MNEINQTIKLMEEKAINLIREMRAIRERALPLPNLDYLSEEDKKIYNDLYNQFKQIVAEHDSLLVKLSMEDRRNINPMRLTAEYNGMLKETEGMPTFQGGYDEFELQKLFSDSLNYGKKAVDCLISSELHNDQMQIQRANEIIGICNKNFSGHYWGESYAAILKEYENRLRSGRTTSDDILEYYEAVVNALNVLVEMANLKKQNNESSQEYQDLEKQFEDIIVSNKKLLGWIPPNTVESVNLNWQRIDMKKDAELFTAKAGNDIEKYTGKRDEQRMHIINEIIRLEEPTIEGDSPRMAAAIESFNNNTNEELIQYCGRLRLALRKYEAEKLDQESVGHKTM